MTYGEARDLETVLPTVVRLRALADSIEQLDRGIRERLADANSSYA